MKKILVGILCLVILMGIVGVVMADTESTTATVTVEEFLSVTLSNDPVTFPNMNPGTGPTAAEITPSIKGYPLIATIGSESNVDADVGTKADASTFTCSDCTPTVALDVNNMEWEDSLISPTWYDYTTSNAEVCASVAPSGTCDIYHQLTVPDAQTAGTYQVGVVVTVTKAL